MKMPTISVIIPVCNVEKYVKQCLDSVINSSLKNIEIICVDDGSTDSCPSILDNYASTDSRVSVIHKKNTGYGNSVNIGISKATGDYISIIESDDFISPSMLETLYNLSENGTIDVVKGNFWDYYETDRHKDAIVNRERAAMDNVSETFTISENPSILWGHPSVWSAIYRRKFLEDNHIKLIEAPGGGWVDNPFFFETLLTAKSIKWTNEPFYYYRKTNANSSSNKQTDLTLPLRRMMDNLDVVEKYHYQDEETLKLVYSRALMYLHGVIPERFYPEQVDKIKAYARKLFARLNENVITNNFNLQDQKLYYTNLSPFDRLIPEKKKILIYNWVQFDNAGGAGGGVTIYCKNLVDIIMKERPDVSVYFLSSGTAYDGSTTNCYISGTNNIFFDRCRSFEIVNSPVPAPQSMIINNPNVAIKNAKLSSVFINFIKRNGPFEAIHFNNIEGLSLDCLDIKKEFPETRLIFSLHNYVPFCTHGFYFNRATIKNCTPNHTGADCIKCTNINRITNISNELKLRASYRTNKEVNLDKWASTLGFDKLDKVIDAHNILDYFQKAVGTLNANMDFILAVSDRVKEIAIENGFDKSKTITSYIGTRVAEFAIQNHRPGLKGKYFKIGYLGNDYNVVEKGYKFLVDALSSLDDTTAGKIDLLLTMRNGDEAELQNKLKKFHSVEIKRGYMHHELKSLLNDVDLGIVPVLWEDNLPQIAIEMVAMNVPILCSSYGGASELCASDQFKFNGGDANDLKKHILYFFNNPNRLNDFWKYNKHLVTMHDHLGEIMKHYGLAPFSGEITISFEDYVLLQKEIDFFRRNFNSSIRGYSDGVRLTLKTIPWYFKKVLYYARTNGIKQTLIRIRASI